MDFKFPLSENGLYRMLNAALLTGVCLFGAGSYFGIASAEVLHILVALIAVSVLTIFNYVSVKGRILCGLGLAGGLCAAGVIAGLDNATQFLISYGNWLLNRPSWQENWITGYEVMQVLFLVLICYVVQMVLEKDFRIKLVVALLFFVALLYCFFKEKELSKAGMAFVVCYLVTVVTEWTQRHWEKVKSRSVLAYMNWMMPFLSVYLIAFLCMPVPEEPYDWQVFKDIYKQVSEAVEKITINIFSFGREDFDVSLSGFSDEGSFGGKVQESETEVMTIQSSSSLKTNVYLTGKVYDTFTGRQWQQSDADFEKERYADTVRTLYAAQRYDKEYQQDYVYRADLHIVYQYFNSRHLFAPLKMWSVDQQNRPLSFEETEGSLLFPTKAGYGTEYDVSFYQLNMGQESFYEFLEAEPMQDEKLLRDILINFKGRTKVELTAEDLKKQELLVWESCLGDVALSRGVEEYLAQITRDAKSDVEKLKAIEAELSTFAYTLTPGNLPEYVTDESAFLDYFLLESKQGYCSYFATAFVLLARAEGIPARFVQGYCVPMQAGKEVTVTSDMAHAWPEVYIDDIGWIPFEPTPGYAKLRYTSWAVQRGKEPVSTDYGDYTVIPDEPEESEEDLEETLEELPGDVEGNQILQGPDTAKIVRIILLSLLSVAPVGALLLLLERQVGRYRYGRMNAEQKYLTEIHRCFKILSWLELSRTEGETLEELKRRISEHLHPAEELHFLEFYEEFLYGHRSVDAEMIQSVKEEQRELLQVLKQRKRWIYLYYCVFVRS